MEKHGVTQNEYEQPKDKEAADKEASSSGTDFLSRMIDAISTGTILKFKVIEKPANDTK